MSGAELVKRLGESGTGQAKLDLGRAVLLADAKATGEQVYAALAAGGAPEGTLEKAQHFLTTGKLPEKSAPPLSIEDRILAQQSAKPISKSTN